MCYEQQETTTVLQCSESVSFPVFQDYSILDRRVSEPLTLPSSDEKLYTEKRLLKKKKFEHVMNLGRNYVPKVDMWFYGDIERYHRAFEMEEHQSSVSEHSDDG